MLKTRVQFNLTPEVANLVTPLCPPDLRALTLIPDRAKKPYSVSFSSTSLSTAAQTRFVAFQRPEARPIGSNGAWLHDKAPTAPRADLKASATAPNNKLLVSNLHYEITPKDLTVSNTSPTSPSILTGTHRHKPSLDDRLAHSFVSH
jgi:hypothetical protein